MTKLDPEIVKALGDHIEDLWIWLEECDMYTPKVIPNLEISFHSYWDAAAVAEKMLENGYVVMVSREEELYILNAIWVGDEANRNDVTFMPRDDFDYYYREIERDDDVDDEEEDSVVSMDQHF